MRHPEQEEDTVALLCWLPPNLAGLAILRGVLAVHRLLALIPGGRGPDRLEDARWRLSPQSGDHDSEASDRQRGHRQAW